jgi:hypothetical protein
MHFQIDSTTGNGVDYMANVFFAKLSAVGALLCITNQAKNLHLDSVTTCQMLEAGKDVVAPLN